MMTLFGAVVLLAAVSFSVGVWEVVRRREQRLAMSLKSLQGGPDAELLGANRGETSKPATFPAPLRWLERRAKAAGIDLRPETAMILLAGGMVTLFVLGLTVTGQLFIAVLASLGGFYAPVLYLQRQQARRAERALGQMNQLCQAIAQTMRGGENLPRALAAAAEELDDPLGAELERVVRMITYGGARPRDAVTELQERIDLPEMKLFVSVVRLHLETGSNLPRSLDELSALIKDRRETQAVLKAATATVRMQADVLTVLPLGLVFLIRSIYPQYFEPLFGNVMGQMLFAVGLGWLAFGRMVMQQQFNRALEG